MMPEREAAKYPFLGKAAELVDTLDIKLEDIANPGYGRILDRGAERVEEAITRGEVSARLADPLTELLSFPIAVMFVTVIGERFLDRRYALGEAVRVYNLMREEGRERIAGIAREEFGWDVSLCEEEVDGQSYGFRLHFSDYLSTASGFHEEKWKLVNRVMRDGYVLLSQMEAARLVQEEVEELIRERVSKHVKIALPEPIQERLEKVSRVFEENRSRLGGEALPSEVINEAFPPCMKHALEGLLSGRRASHMERFGLTSFLIHAGMEIDDIVDLYVSVTDFDESLTRYQIEHIAGMRGGRTRYTPPTCSTLRTHGICRDRDDLCDRVKHPLGYYRIEARRLGKKQETEPAEGSESNK